jgi:hypothetical protein
VWLSTTRGVKCYEKCHFQRRILIICLSLFFTANGNAVAELSENEACAIARELGAGVLSYSQLSTYENFEISKFKQKKLLFWDKCYERGRKYGLKTDEEIEEIEARKRMSPEEFNEWRKEKRLERIERKAEEAKILAQDAAAQAAYAARQSGY